MTITHYKRHGVDGDLTFDKVSLSTKLILDTAKEQGIKCETIPYTGLFKLSFQGKTEYLHAQPPSRNSRTSVYCCSNKAITKNLLKACKIAVPKGFIIKKSDTKRYWSSVYNALSKPLVVKPIDSSLAKNVYANIHTKTDYLKKIKDIFQYYGEIKQDLLVEEMFNGTEYRIIATRDKVVGIMSRVVANVVGDGNHTIKELVAEKNLHIWRGGEFALHTITIGTKEKAYLKKNGWSLTDIPPKKTRILIHNEPTTSIDDGGDTIDCTTKVHPSVIKIAVAAIRAIPGLEWGGIDFFSRDITKPQGSKDYIVLEINSSPNIAWQEFPAVGGRRKVALEYLKVVFPQLKERKRESPITKKHPSVVPVILPVKHEVIYV